jgi:2-dehydro-3-deoxyphosphogluconate aldolase/(4S)-4-hydroxy-2-oxoglutarate aldolase
MQHSILDRVASCGVVPVIAIEDATKALPLADALLAGGLPIIEITFRRAGAAEAIGTIARERPEMIVGAGTVLTPAQVDLARDKGAAFGVAPGVNPRTIEHARQVCLPFIPGVATPTEVETALALGCNFLKFFPAEALGGVAMLEALASPFLHVGVRFMPTGGVNKDNLESYLRLDFVAAAGGTWIARNDDLAAGRWQEISNRCRAALAIVARVRERR